MIPVPPIRMRAGLVRHVIISAAIGVAFIVLLATALVQCCGAPVNPASRPVLSEHH